MLFTFPDLTVIKLTQLSTVGKIHSQQLQYYFEVTVNGHKERIIIDSKKECEQVRNDLIEKWKSLES